MKYSGRYGYIHGTYLTQSSGGTGTSSSSGKGQAVANRAYRYRGAQYEWGATGPSKFDCSGFVQAMYRYNGISIPRNSSGQAYGGRAVSRSSLRPGDVLIFQNTGGRSGISHVGIYLGGGQFIQMSNPSTDVNINSINESYYRNHWWGARRYT